MPCSRTLKFDPCFRMRTNKAWSCVFTILTIQIKNISAFVISQLYCLSVIRKMSVRNNWKVPTNILPGTIKPNNFSTNDLSRNRDPFLFNSVGNSKYATNYLLKHSDTKQGNSVKAKYASKKEIEENKTLAQNEKQKKRNILLEQISEKINSFHQLSAGSNKPNKQQDISKNRKINSNKYDQRGQKDELKTEIGNSFLSIYNSYGYENAHNAYANGKRQHTDCQISLKIRSSAPIRHKSFEKTDYVEIYEQVQKIKRQMKQVPQCQSQSQRKNNSNSVHQLRKLSNDDQKHGLEGRNRVYKYSESQEQKCKVKQTSERATKVINNSRKILNKFRHNVPLLTERCSYTQENENHNRNTATKLAHNYSCLQSTQSCIDSELCCGLVHSKWRQKYEKTQLNQASTYQTIQIPKLELYRTSEEISDFENILNQNHHNESVFHQLDVKLSLDDFRVVSPVKQQDKQHQIIGNGKFGKVYLCEHKPTNLLVALKRISKQIIRKYQIIQEVIDEIKIHTSLDHHNITKCYGVFQTQTDIYLVLEYVHGQTLFDYLNDIGSLPLIQALRCLKDIIKAVAFIHEKSIAHRDIKPENILLSQNSWNHTDHCVAKLCDFGWATVITSPKSKYCGTFDYLSPQMHQRKKYDISVDVWSIGVLTYEILTGRVPYQGDDRSARALNKIHQIQLQFPESSAQFPIEAMEFIEALLRKNPSQRPKCSQLLDMDLFRKHDEQIRKQVSKKIERENP